MVKLGMVNGAGVLLLSGVKIAIFGIFTRKNAIQKIR